MTARRIVVTTDDGTLFSCTPFEMGGVSAPRQVRWTLIDSRGLEYIGPPYARGQSPADVRSLVCAWWEGKKGLGQAGVNVDVMRRRVLDGTRNSGTTNP